MLHSYYSHVVLQLLVTHAGVRARLEAWLGVTKLRSVRDTLQQAVRLSEQRFEAQALVLARLPAVMARITAAVVSLLPKPHVFT